MVYVNDAFIPYGRMKMSHLWSPDLEELNAMARKLKLRREWLQDQNPYFIYYAVCKSKRKKAIELGAEPVSITKMRRLRLEFRQHGKIS